MRYSLLKNTIAKYGLADDIYNFDKAGLQMAIIWIELMQPGNQKWATAI